MSDDPSPEADRFLKAKLEALAEFAAGAGHEINNPLATIINHVQILLRQEQDPARRQSLLSIASQAHRIRDMIGDAMLFARPPQPNPVAVSLKDVVNEVSSALAGEFAVTATQLDVNVPLELVLWADRTQLCIVLSSLLKNSLEASGTGTTIHVYAAASQPISMFSITDQGHILSEAEREHLFDPFYSGRQAGRGLGFGLSKAWRIIAQHGGRIEVDSTAEKTEFRVFWPAEESVRPGIT